MTKTFCGCLSAWWGVMGICNSVKTDGRNLLLPYFFAFVLFLPLLVSNNPAFQGFT